MKTLEVFLGIQLLLVISFVCADDELPACPELACDKECPYGLAVGVTGCPSCECRDEVCQPVTCSLGKICKKFHLTNTETNIPRCVDPTMSERCQLPMDSGKCRGNQIQWFYDSDTNQCQEFGYGGCPGNDNRFETKEDCDVGCDTSCGDIMCMMYCEKGFKKDSRGCDICFCDEADPAILPIESVDKTFAVGLGCDENGEVSCDLQCPHGYERDQYECEICKCKVPSTCITEPCSTECPFGFLTDNDGCPICECREEGECNEVVCQMFCDFGLKKDKNGCNRCECNPHPCTTHACPKDTYCDLSSFSTGDANITCLMQWSADCPSVSCMLYCENSFKSDIYGCPVCDCLETPRKSCLEFMCQRVCDFGFQKDQFACDVCKCLPDPCQDKTCNNDEVCETVNDCIGSVCSHSAKCSENDSIKRVRVHLSFSHKKPLDPELMDEFLQKMKESFAGILKVDESQITDMKASQDNKTVHVTFHVVGAGDENLVKTWKMAETHLMTKSTESAITYAGQDFVPQHDSLVSLYSSNEEPEDGAGGGNATMTIVIACAVVGVIILVVAGIVSMYYAKSKKEKKRKNVIYKQAPGETPEV